jgi:hypothetical protein
MGNSVDNISNILRQNATVISNSLLNVQPSGDPPQNALNLSTSSLQFLTNTALLDLNGNTILDFMPVSNSVNYVTFANAASGSGPAITTAGTDSAINLHLSLLYTTGNVIINGAGLTLTQSYSTLKVGSYPTVTADTVANRLALQLIDVSQPVTNNNKMGAILTAGFNLTPSFNTSFILKNTYINANSIVMVTAGGLSNGSYYNYFNIGAGSCQEGQCTINVTSITGNTINSVKLTIYYAVF